MDMDYLYQNEDMDVVDQDQQAEAVVDGGHGHDRAQDDSPVFASVAVEVQDEAVEVQDELLAASPEDAKIADIKNIEQCAGELFVPEVAVAQNEDLDQQLAGSQPDEQQLPENDAHSMASSDFEMEDEEEEEDRLQALRNQIQEQEAMRNQQLFLLTVMRKLSKMADLLGLQTNHLELVRIQLEEEKKKIALGWKELAQERNNFYRMKARQSQRFQEEK